MTREQMQLIEKLESIAKMLYSDIALFDVEILFLIEKEDNCKEHCLYQIENVKLDTIVKTKTGSYMNIKDYLSSMAKGVAQKDESHESKQAIVVTLKEYDKT